MKLIMNTFGVERVAMLSLWALSVLLLQHGAQGTRMASSRVQVAMQLPPCNFPESMPGLKCFDPPWLAGLPPCEFKHQMVGIDCLPILAKSSPAVKVWTPPVTKIWWLKCFKCFEILVHCGVCFIEFAGFLIAQNHNVADPAGAVSTLNFYNFDTSGHPDVAILAEHETPSKTNTIRVWKSGFDDPNNVNQAALNLSSKTFCDYTNCVTSIHNCWKCLGNLTFSDVLTKGSVSADYNFDAGLAPFYDVAIRAAEYYETPTSTKTIRGIFRNNVVDRPVGNWRANFSLDVKYLEISVPKMPLPPCSTKHHSPGLDCWPR